MNVIYYDQVTTIEVFTDLVNLHSKDHVNKKVQNMYTSRYF